MIECKREIFFIDTDINFKQEREEMVGATAIMQRNHVYFKRDLSHDESTVYYCQYCLNEMDPCFSYCPECGNKNDGTILGE